MENTNISNNNNFQEISLRELLETLWKGKVLIAVITAVAVLIAAVATFFIIPEKYESSVVLRTNAIKVSSTYSGEEAAAFADLEAKLNLTPTQYAEYMKSPEFLKILAEDLNLTNKDGTKLTGKSIGGLISTTVDTPASTVKATVIDTDSSRTYAIASQLETSFIKYLNEFINKNVELYDASLQNNITLAKEVLNAKEASLNDFRRENGSVELLSDEVTRLQNRVKELNENISEMNSEITGDIASLDSLLEELEQANAIDEAQLSIIAQLKQAVTEDSGNELDSDLYIEADLNSGDNQISQSVRILELNRLQMRLLNNYNKKAADTRQLSETEVQYQDKQQQLTEIQPLYANYKAEYDIALSTYSSYMKRITAAKVFADLEIASNFITQMAAPEEPEAPVSPNKMLNLAIGVVLGLILGVFVVFAREYWKSSVAK